MNSTVVYVNSYNVGPKALMEKSQSRICCGTSIITSTDSSGGAFHIEIEILQYVASIGLIVLKE